MFDQFMRLTIERHTDKKDKKKHLAAIKEEEEAQ